MHVDMTSYEKIYDLKAENELPERIFLDKGTSYSFSVFLRAGLRLGHARSLNPALCSKQAPPSRC